MTDQAMQRRLRHFTGPQPHEVYRGSIIVPAYNEVNRIGTLLPVLELAARDLSLLVIVACNGCSDNTAELVSQYPSLKTLKIDRADKCNAINFAETFAHSIFPRLYIDADVEIDLRGISALFEALSRDEPLAVVPLRELNTTESPWLVRSYCAVERAIRNLRRHEEQSLGGHGLYGTNRAGRRHFGRFPEEIRADDSFFESMFHPSLRRTICDAVVILRPPDSTRALIRQKTRVAASQPELRSFLELNYPQKAKQASKPRSRLHRKLLKGLKLIRHPSLFAPTLVWIFVTGLANVNHLRLRLVGQRPEWR